MLRMEAVTTKSQGEWKALLGRLGWSPQWVVCDNDRDA